MRTGATKRQREAIENHTRSMVVTAGAGTGKTFVLVEKYLSLIEQEGLRPREILAMTFTDKAAAEMKERVRETIGRRISNEPENAFWKEVAEEVIIAPIMTFHSFCAHILREFAIEAGLEPGFQIIDEGRTLSIHKEAFDHLLKRTKPDSKGDALVRVLAQVEKFRLQEILAVISDRNDRFGTFFDELSKDQAGIIKQWQNYLKSVREPEVSRFFAEKDNTTAISDLIRLSRRYCGAEDSAAQYLEKVSPCLVDIRVDASPMELSKAVEGFLSVKPRGRIGSKKVWESDDLVLLRKSKVHLTSVLSRVAPYFSLFLDENSSLTRSTVAFFSDLAIISGEYQHHYNLLKQQESGMDFGDLITLAKKFLHENQDLVSEHLRPRIKYILVDEFQDTDPAQFDIICDIIGELKPGTRGLFIVGDPKQSIYLFRDADVTRFKEAQSRILVNCKGILINLDTSFRSSREVIGIVNYLFEGLFFRAEKPWEFGYEPLVTCDARRDSPGSFQIMLPEKAESGGTSSDTKEIEAGMVAELIHRIVESGALPVTDRNGSIRPAEYGDIAILIERRTHLSRYIDALSRLDTPYYVHGGIGFYSRQEICDIYNILSFILRPYDDAALYGTLRSPYFSLSDRILFRIMTSPGPVRGATLFERMDFYLKQNGNKRETESIKAITRAFKILSGWIEYAGRTPVVILISRIICESNILTIYGAMEQGDQQIANLEKLTGIARIRSEKGGYGLAELVSDMTSSIGTEEREGEAAIETLSKTSVNIMTVHAAKGLEFPVVILPDMGSSREGKLPSILCGERYEVVGVKLPDPDKDYEIAETPVYTALSLIQKEKESAERKRLFYVGATRARDHLIFCGKKPTSFYRTVDESSNRIDWAWTLLGITDELIVNKESIFIEPYDKGDPIEIRILTDPDQLTREWAYDQPSLLSPPPEYLKRKGERDSYCSLPDVSLPLEKTRKVWGLSNILESMRHNVNSNPEKFKIPESHETGPEETGIIIHQIFSGADIKSVLKAHGISSDEALSWCRERLELFLNHGLIKQVSENYCELGFVLPLGQVYLEGRMDRLCRLDDGKWIVIDYKSGDCECAKLQLSVYALAAEKLTGQPVIACIYHIDSDELELVDTYPEEEIKEQIETGIIHLIKM